MSTKRKHSEDDRASESEGEGKQRNRSSTKDRERQWQTVQSSEDDSSSSSDSDSDSDASSMSERESKRHKKESKKSKKEHKKESKHKKDKKDKKHKKEHKKDKKKDKKQRKDDKKPATKSISVNQNEYGKYGIIKEENIFHKQRYIVTLTGELFDSNDSIQCLPFSCIFREFEAYMAEVRGVPGVMSESKRDVRMHITRRFLCFCKSVTLSLHTIFNLGDAALQDVHGGLQHGHHATREVLQLRALGDAGISAQ